MTVRLFHALVGERRIEPALHPAREVPFGLSMPNDEDLFSLTSLSTARAAGYSPFPPDSVR